jgi:hypothetical protein
MTAAPMAGAALDTAGRGQPGALITPAPAPIAVPQYRAPAANPPPGYLLPRPLPTDTVIDQQRREKHRRAAAEGGTASPEKQPAHTSPSGSAPARGGLWGWVIGVLLVAAATAGLVVWRPWAQGTSAKPSVVDTHTSLVCGAGDQGDCLPPGIPDVSVQRVNATTLRFTWDYDAPLDSDTYLWRRTDSDTQQAVTEPVVDIVSPAGTRVCIVVKVVRADGSYGTVAWSPEGCGS